MSEVTGCSAYFDGHLIAHLSSCSFAGSSSPMTDTFPRAKGALLRPSGTAERKLTLDCVWLGEGFTKTEIEWFQHNLIEQAALSDTGTLEVNGNTYEDVFISGINFNNVVNKERMEFSVDYVIPNASYFKNALINSAQVRPASFDYTYRKNDTEEGNFAFNVYNNFEAASSVSFDDFSRTRPIFSYGPLIKQAGGIEEITLNCFLIQSPTKEIESYFYNVICGFGPLGKQGTLSLNNNVYNRAILTSFSHTKIKSNSDSSGGASHAEFTMTFNVSLQC